MTEPLAAPPSWNSYPKVYNLGHPDVLPLTNDPVYVEEKVDGSQFSFALGYDGELLTRSKGVSFNPHAAPALFAPSVETALRLATEGKLISGYTYRAEALCKPKHNTLKYGRVPQGNLILFDVAFGSDGYLDRPSKEEEAARLGLEIVPLLSPGLMIGSPEQLLGFLDRESCLGGGCKVEGVVLKQVIQKLYVRDKPAIGKFVSTAFREANKTGGWREGRESSNDIITLLVAQYANEARWTKAIQHLRDDGFLTNSPQDIGPLMKEIANDIQGECAEDIKNELFKWAYRRIASGASRGFPEFYKRILLDQQFAANDNEKPAAQVLGIPAVDASSSQIWGS